MRRWSKRGPTHDPRPGRHQANLRRDDPPRPPPHRRLGPARLGPEDLDAAAASRPPSFGRAKSCILLYLYGAPSQLETFDPKPDAPAEVRGEFGCHPHLVPGLNVCEGLPHLARVMDKACLIRSVTHPYPNPRGRLRPDRHPPDRAGQELNPRDAVHWPFIGSVVDYVDARDRVGPSPECPATSSCPGPSAASAWARSPAPALTAGSSAPPMTPSATEFVGTGTVKAPGRPSKRRPGTTSSPIAAITPESRFRLGVFRADAARIDPRPPRPPPLPAAAARIRRPATLDADASGVDRHRSMAHSLLGSDAAPPRLRPRPRDPRDPRLSTG